MHMTDSYRDSGLNMKLVFPCQYTHSYETLSDVLWELFRDPTFLQHNTVLTVKMALVPGVQSGTFKALPPMMHFRLKDKERLKKNKD